MARMLENYTTNMCLFSWLPCTLPKGRPQTKMEGCGQERSDLRAIAKCIRSKVVAMTKSQFIGQDGEAYTKNGLET